LTIKRPSWRSAGKRGAIARGYSQIRGEDPLNGKKNLGKLPRYSLKRENSRKAARAAKLACKGKKV